MSEQPEQLSEVPSGNITTEDLFRMLGLKEVQRTRLAEMNVALQEQIRTLTATNATLKAQLAAGPEEEEARIDGKKPRKRGKAAQEK